MTIKIREYKSTDKEIVRKLFENYLSYFVEIDPLKRVVKKPNSASYFAGKMLTQVKENDGIVYIAEEGDEIVGFTAGILQIQKEEGLLEAVPSLPGRVIELYVKEEYRNKGIGKMLIEKAEDYFRGRGCDVVFIEVFQPNKDAREFYKNLGYSDRVIDLIKLL